MNTNDLSGTNWILSEIPGMEEVPEEMRRKPGFLRFDETGRFSASAGCNNMMGGWSIEEDKLTFAAGPTTLMACPPPLMKLEQMVMKALNDTDSFSIEGQQLKLLKGEETLAVFTENTSK